jgi:hypothetical protein
MSIITILRPTLLPYQRHRQAETRQYYSHCGNEMAAMDALFLSGKFTLVEVTGLILRCGRLSKKHRIPVAMVAITRLFKKENIFFQPRN